MHVELVPPTEALVAQLTFKRLLTWTTRAKNMKLYPILESTGTKITTGGRFWSYQCGFSGVVPCLSGRTAS